MVICVVIMGLSHGERDKNVLTVLGLNKDFGVKLRMGAGGDWGQMRKSSSSWLPW